MNQQPTRYDWGKDALDLVKAVLFAVAVIACWYLAVPWIIAWGQGG